MRGPGGRWFDGGPVTSSSSSEIPKPAPLTAKWAGLPPRVAIGFAVAVASIAAAAACSFAALSARSAASEGVQHTAVVRLAAEELESSLLTSDARLDAALARGGAVDAYQRARSRVPRALDELVAACLTDPVESEIVARVVPEVAAFDDAQARALAHAAAGDASRADAVYHAEVGPAVARAHACIGELEALEGAEMPVRAAQHARAVRRSYAIFLAAEAVLLVLVLVAARIVRSEIRRRERYAAALTHAIEVRQRLVAVVSHDLRNPLSVVIGSAWTLDRLPLADEGRRALRRIASASRRMHRLVRDLLDWSRADAGADVPIVPQETDLSELCARVAEDVASGGNRVTVACDGDPRALVDPDRIEQVVSNLVTNALRHGAQDKPVRVRVSSHGPEVQVEVRDDGPGIAPELRPTLFEPFHPAHPARQDGRGEASVGLGLYVVRLLTEAHGGHVHVESAPGAGTTFVVTLPRAPAPARAAPAATVDERSAFRVV